MTFENVSQIAATLNLSAEQLFQEALVSLLREKKREVLQARLEFLNRHRVVSADELETHVREGLVIEHPAWEDLITIENLEARLEELDGYLADLQGA